MGDGGDIEPCVAVGRVACAGEGTRISCSSNLLGTSEGGESGGEFIFALPRCIGGKLRSVDSARAGEWAAGEEDVEAGGIETS